MIRSTIQSAARRNIGFAACVFLLAAVALLFQGTGVVQAAEKTTLAKKSSVVCPTIDAWLISTRHLPCTHGAFPATGPALRYWQRVDNQGPWLPRTYEDFLAASQEIRTTWIMVHGNRMTSQDAVNYVSQVTRSLLPGHQGEMPLRTITWSWPSEQIHGLAADVRTKAARTPSESFYLGWLVNQMPAPTPIVYIGHSFGARVGTGTMHLLAGGALHGYGLAGIDPTRQLSRAIFTASAIHNNWLLPGAPHGRALDQAESVLFINNSCDPALKRYRFIDRSRPEAIGYCGAMIDAGRRYKVKQIDACGSVGKTHDSSLFMRAGSLLLTMRSLLPIPILLPIPAVSQNPGPFRGYVNQLLAGTAEGIAIRKIDDEAVALAANDE